MATLSLQFHQHSGAQGAQLSHCEFLDIVLLADTLRVALLLPDEVGFQAWHSPRNAGEVQQAYSACLALFD